MELRCSWCGESLEPDDGYRVGEQPGARRAAFCRLEHVVPWAIQGPHWDAGEIEQPAEIDDRCAQCGEALGDVRLVIVRHRGEHRIPDAFCSVAHMADWAKAGGRYGAAP